MNRPNQRYTINVKDLRSKVNQMLSCDIPEGEKKALCVLLESFLHDTRNYNGFKFAGKDKNPDINAEGYYHRYYF